MKAPFRAYQGTEPFIFVSYSHGDQAAVFEELERLRTNGFNLWFDEGITPGEEWTAELAQRIRDASHFLFLVTPNSAASKNCRDEVAFALKHDKPMVIAHLRHTDLPDSLELSIGSMQGILKQNLSEQAFHAKLDAALGADTASGRAFVNAPSAKRTRRKTSVYTGLLVLAAILAGWLVSQQPSPSVDAPVNVSIDTSSPVPGFSGRAAIAVLPFVNMSNDPDQEYFADGITEDLITGLQSFQSFPIIARTSTFTYKGTATDVRDIATTLGAGYVIEGSVRKVADNVRINAQLINRQGQHVWADKYDFEFQDVLRIQADLVSRILLAIEPELIISEADRTRFVRTEDMEAYDYFLQASTNTFAPFAFSDLNGQPVSPERLEIARRDATKAVEIDPTFAAGWRMLNHIDGSYVVNLAYTLTEPGELEATLARAIAHGERSRQLSPFEPTVCSCLAAMLLISGDVDGARLLQEESLRQNPANAGVHAVMAKILQVDGDPSRALEEILLAKRLSPEDMAMTTYLYFEAAIQQDLGNFQAAIAAANKSLLLSPLNYDAEIVKITATLAAGQRAAAERALAELKASRPSDFQPISGWDQPFPATVAESVDLSSGAPLAGLRYNDGLRLVFEDLGWVGG